MRRRLTHDNPVIGFLMDNLGWITVSLLLALLVWVVAMLDQNPIEQREFNELITIRYLEETDDNDVLLDTATLRRTARVTIRAPRSTWDELSRGDIAVYADLRELRPGIHTVELQGDLSNDDLSGRVVSISPEDITVEIVPSISIEIPVRTDVFNELDEYDFEQPICDNDTVTVSGPTAIVDQIATARVRLSLERPNQSFISPVELIDPNGDELAGRNLDNLAIDPEQIQCQIDTRKIDNIRTVIVDVSFQGSAPNGYAIVDRSWEPQEVTVIGDENALAQLGGIVTTEPIDISGQTSDFSRTVPVVLPPGVQLRQETTRITVNISIEPIVTTVQFAELPVQIENLSSGHVAEVVPDTVNITVEGPAPLIGDLTEQDLRVVVDLAGLDTGTHTNLIAQVSILNEAVREVATASAEPSTLRVVITSPTTATATTTPRPTDIQE